MKYFLYNKFIISIFALLIFVPIQASTPRFAAFDLKETKNFFNNILNGNIEKVNYFLTKNNVRDLNFLLVAPDENLEKSPLQFAVISQNLDMVKLFIKKRAGLHFKDHFGITPFLEAVINESHTIAQYLYKLDPSVVKDVTKKGETALHLATTNPSVKMVEWLLKLGLNSNIRSQDGSTVLMYALTFPTLNLYEIVKLLLSNGADVNLLDDEQESPLFKAAKNNLYKETQLLIQAKTDINSACKDGHTPLMMACGHEKDPHELVEMLVKNGANIEQKNIFKGTVLSALYIALLRDNHKTAATLLKNGANFDHEILYKAIRYGPDSICNFFVDTNSLTLKQKQQLLLSPDSPLYLPVCEGKVELMQKFSSLFENPKQTIQMIIIIGSFNTLLHLAIIYKQFEMVKYLINNFQLDVNRSNAYGDTPLHLAVMYGLIPSVSFLLDCGADPTQENDNKKIASQLISKSLSPEKKRYMELVLEKKQYNIIAMDC